MGCKDIGIRKSEFVTKTQFLWGISKKFWENRKRLKKFHLGEISVFWVRFHVEVFHSNEISAQIKIIFMLILKILKINLFKKKITTLFFIKKPSRLCSQYWLRISVIGVIGWNLSILGVEINPRILWGWAPQLVQALSVSCNSIGLQP